MVSCLHVTSTHCPCYSRGARAGRYYSKYATPPRVHDLRFAYSTQVCLRSSEEACVFAQSSDTLRQLRDVAQRALGRSGITVEGHIKQDRAVCFLEERVAGSLMKGSKGRKGKLQWLLPAGSQRLDMRSGTTWGTLSASQQPVLQQINADLMHGLQA